MANGTRISLEEDPRVFTPVARQSYKWDRIYKARTSVERVNSRLDVSYGFENHTVRGIDKMELKCSLSLMVMLLNPGTTYLMREKEKFGLVG